MLRHTFASLSLLAGIFSFALSAPAVAQNAPKPASWTYQVEQEGATATLVITARLSKGWHMYSQSVPDGGPLPTEISFEKSKEYELVGKAIESGNIKETYDSIFEMKYKYFSDKAVFRQAIRVKSAKDFAVKVHVAYQVCEEGRCINEETDGSFTVKGAEQGTEPAVAPGADSAASSAGSDTGKAGTTAPGTVASSGPDSNAGGSLVSSLSFWAIFFEGFIGGFIALLTPCVFPMIPLTVSYFTKKNHSRVKGAYQAGIYGMSIIVIYVLIGFMVTRLLGADALNDMASNGIFNLIFFLLLIVFAASFFGAFEITLPSSWVNKADQRSEKGGLMGIFFMAFTLALVSFSCTGPIIGTLLFQAASGGIWGPLAGMTGFSLALALPFGIFAAFPSLMKSLPKSGGWLNSVKVVLGFLELALSLKFLSTVDLAYHWGILDREVFLVLWIVIFTLLGLYLLGKLRFSHDSDLPYITIPRLFLAILCFSFSLYMVPGLWGAPLKAISAFSPPQATQDFDLTRLSVAAPAGSQEKIEPKKNVVAHCPHNLNCFFDYEEGMAYAKKVGKPVFIDFTGWSCVNCRKMEVSVWSDPMVLKRLHEDYVLISLYVDDKTELPEKEQYVSSLTGKKIKTVGNKWSELQNSRFQISSQPYYVLLDHSGNLLVKPHAYDLNVKSYIKFLDSGKEEFAKRSGQQ
jgi:thiol:disulfide interchange protein